MWWFASKKKVKKSLKKIGNQIKHLQTNSINEKKVDQLIQAAIKEVQFVPNITPNPEPNKDFESIIVQKAKKRRPELIKRAIRELIERDLSTTNIFNIIVEEKRLCGKTQFYHYLSLVRAELRTTIRPKVRTKQ